MLRPERFFFDGLIIMQSGPENTEDGDDFYFMAAVYVADERQARRLTHMAS